MKFHEKRFCEALNCVVKECLNRHPEFCKFLRDYGYCKFGEYCKFSHKAFGMKSDVEKEELKKLKEKLENSKMNLLNIYKLKLNYMRVSLRKSTRSLIALSRKNLI